MKQLKQQARSGKTGFFVVRMAMILCVALFNKKEAVKCQPVINSISPMSGAVNATVTITGSNFNTNASNNAVFFGAARASVTMATASSLTVQVPSGAVYGSISVINLQTNLGAASRNYFTPTFSPQTNNIGTDDFQARLEIGTGALNPSAVRFGDIDSDGKVDIVFAHNNGFSVIRNMSNPGSTSFATRIDFTAGAQPNDLSIGDINGDGKLDVVVVNGENSASGNSVSVFANTSNSSNISFAPRVNFTTNIHPSAVTIADYDGNGRMDLGVACGTGAVVSILRNTSTGTTINFASRIDISTGVSFSATSIDYSGDGKPDLAVCNSSGSTVTLFRNTSTVGVISFSNNGTLTVGSRPFYVSSGDIDGDEKSDLIVCNYDGNSLSILRNTSTSTTTSFASGFVLSNIASPRGTAIGDVDGDGKPDIFCASFFDNKSYLIRNNSTVGNASFDPGITFQNGPSVNGVTRGRGTDIADIDGDGRSDIVIANNQGNSLSIFINAPDVPAPIPPVISSINPLAAAPGASITITGNHFHSDVNGNTVLFGSTLGRVTAASTNSLTVEVPSGAIYGPLTVTTNTRFSAKSSQFFVPIVNAPAPGVIANNFSPKIDYPTLGTPENLTIRDINRDGKSDLILSHFSGGRISFSLNSGGAGTFNFPQQSPYNISVSNPNTLALADMDGDNAIDIISTSTNPNSMSIVLSRTAAGSASLDFASTNFSLINNGAPSALAVEDLDLDGRPDVIMTIKDAANILIRPNTTQNGVISFGTNLSVPSTIAQPERLAIADLDGDARPELIIFSRSGAGARQIIIFRNVSTPGAFTFIVPVVLNVTHLPHEIAIGDLDGDQKNDIVLVNPLISDKTFSVLKNESTIGNINFAPEVRFSTGDNPALGIIIADVNGDGKPDVGVSHAEGNNVTIFSNSGNTGAAQFLNGVIFGVGANPRAIAIGDLDNDGTPEIITGNYGSNNISVIRNAPPPPMVQVNGTLAALSTIYGTPSSTTSFTITATGLINNISITAPAGFELSTNSSTGFANSISISANDDVSDLPVYLRLSASQAGTFAGDIIISTTGIPSIRFPAMSSTVQKRTVTLTGIQIASKAYDGNTTATINSTPELSNLLDTDIANVSVSTGSATFSSAAAGTAKPVMLSGFSLSGTAAANYLLNLPDQITGTITRARVSIVGLTARNKIYDGTVATSLNGSAAISGVFLIDFSNVSLSGTGIPVFENANAGINKAVRVEGYTLTGVQASNYELSDLILQASITPKTVSLSQVTVSDKEYDGTTSAVITGTPMINGVLLADASNVGVVSGTGAFSNSNVGTNKPVSFSGFSLDGSSAGNYELSAQPAGTTATILAAPVIIQGIEVESKLYDGTVAAVISGTAIANGIVNSDISSVSLNTGIAVFENASVGNNKTVVISGYNLSGAASGNYRLIQPTGYSANITPVMLTVSGLSVSDKIYDGEVNAVLTGSPILQGLLLSDVQNVQLAGTGIATFSNKNAGMNKQVNVTGYSLAGTAAGNYLFQIDISGNILVKSLQITAGTFTKTYGESLSLTTDALNKVTVTGLVPWDEVNSIILTSSASVATASAGRYILVPSDATGSGLGNYNITYQNGEILVQQASLVISYKDQAQCEGREYQYNNQDFSVTGLLFNDAVTSVDLQNSMLSGQILSPGVYPISISNAQGNGIGNYTIMYTAGTLTVFPKPVINAIRGNLNVCVGASTQLQNSVLNGLWSSSNTQIATVTDLGQVNGIRSGSVTINYITRSPEGCIAETSSQVTVHAIPDVSIGSNRKSVSRGDTVLLRVTTTVNNASIVWSPGNSLNDSTIFMPIARPLTNTTYSATVTSSEGCSSQASILIDSKEDFLALQYGIVVSPNGDGVNDNFVIQNIDAYPQNRLRVFDKAGRLVYEAENYRNTWNATIRNVPLSTDTYFYILYSKGAIVKKGAISIINK